MKKIIAREFLYLFGTVILTIIISIVSIKISDLNFHKRSELKEKINNLTKREKLPYRLKIYYFLEREGIINTEDKYLKRENFIATLKNEVKAGEIFDEYVFPNVDKHNYYEQNSDKSEKDLVEKAKRKFLLENANDNDSENYLLKIKIEEDNLRHVKNSIFNSTDFLETARVCSIIIFSVFFLSRYIIYALKWSLKQMNE